MAPVASRGIGKWRYVNGARGAAAGRGRRGVGNPSGRSPSTADGSNYNLVPCPADVLVRMGLPDWCAAEKPLRICCASTSLPPDCSSARHTLWRLMARRRRFPGPPFEQCRILLKWWRQNRRHSGIHRGRRGPVAVRATAPGFYTSVSVLLSQVRYKVIAQIPEVLR